MSRLPRKVEAQQQRGQISNVQTVHFQKRRLNMKYVSRLQKLITANKFYPRTIAASAIAAYVCYNIYSKLVLDPLERAAVEALKDMPEELTEEDHKPLFIPFPGTTKQLKPKPYRGTDPEWQEFIKFSKDQKLAQRVRGKWSTLLEF